MIKSIVICLLIVVFITLFEGCSKTPEVIISGKVEKLVFIPEWKLFGSFEFDTLTQDSKSTFQNEDLKIFGVNENNISLMSLDSLNYCVKEQIIIENSNGRIRFKEYAKKPIENKSNFYGYTIINSPINQEVYMISDGSRNYTIWLNGNEIVRAVNKQNTAKVGDQITPITLKEGKNLLFIKVGRGSNLISWELIVAMAPKSVAYDVYYKNYFSDFIVDPISNDSISFYLGPHRNGKLMITAEDGKFLNEYSFHNINNSGVLNLNVEDLSFDNFYRANIIVNHNNDTLQEWFYHGDYSKLIEQLTQKITLESVSEYNPILDRLMYLETVIVDENSVSETRFYNKNKVFYAYNLKKQVANVTGNKPSGTYIFNVIADDNLNNDYFLFNVSQSILNKSKIPIVIMMPYIISDDRTLVESWYIGNLDQIEMDSRLAEKSGFAVLWPYFNGDSMYPTDGIGKLVESIKKLNESFNIDYENIYILGDCYGGGRAIVYAGKKPYFFAGVAVFGPVTLKGQFENIPIKFVTSFKNLPIYIQHGENDLISPIENSLAFVEKAHEYGIYPVFEKKQVGHLELSKDYHFPGFLFFDSIYHSK